MPIELAVAKSPGERISEDAVIVGRETQRRLGGEFEFESLGEREVRNVEDPVPVFRLAAPAALRASR